jgi:hypothetical protein
LGWADFGHGREIGERGERRRRKKGSGAAFLCISSTGACFGLSCNTLISLIFDYLRSFTGAHGVWKEREPKLAFLVISCRVFFLFLFFGFPSIAHVSLLSLHLSLSLSEEQGSLSSPLQIPGSPVSVSPSEMLRRLKFWAKKEEEVAEQPAKDDQGNADGASSSDDEEEEKPPPPVNLDDFAAVKRALDDAVVEAVLDRGYFEDGRLFGAKLGLGLAA